MGINKFNCEGYYDPTAYEALTRIENEARKLRSFRPVVYICSPLSGDLEGNQEKAGALLPLRRGRRVYPHCASSVLSPVHG